MTGDGVEISPARLRACGGTLANVAARFDAELRALQADLAVTGAFAKAVKDPETGTWTGRYRGITIQGFYDPVTNTVRHGFPTLPSGGTR